MKYSGPVRIYDTKGFLLTVGTIDVSDDEEQATWVGTLSVIDGTGVAGKALVVDLVMGDQKGRAQLIPESVKEGMAMSRVIGLSPVAIRE
ncbi:MAG: hypothetical protein LC739_02545 [Actinobacteria bacterium]|nr:hypothetical protein [Actinomycetota bacterium]